MRRLVPAILLLALTTGVAGCNNNDTAVTTPTTTTTPATAPVTETFTGKLNTNGASTFPFTATAAGAVTVTLTTLSPDATLAIGLSLGTWTGSACQVVIANDAAVQGAAVPGTVTSAASLCARVYDTGKVVTSVDFTLSVVHP